MPLDDGQTETVLSTSNESGALEGTFVVTVREGPDKGLSLALEASQPSRLLIGQSPACDLKLTDREVSRRHASLEVVDDGIRITDLNSTNGTFVDRVRIVEAYLQGGEMIRVGSTVLAIDYESDARRAPLPDLWSFGRVLGHSREMRRLYPLCARLAASNVPVIIEGETGTGKEVLAEALHEQGPRASGPFVVFDCTAAPPNLVESELFGHERGAFTGAVAARKGVFEQAHGGTLLIDEIGDLELSLQPKLLRALERSEVRRVGGDRWLKVDVRVLAATRRDLDREVAAGRFRDDLFHRLAVGRIELPPLRHRKGDVSLIARTIWRELGADERTLPNDVLQRWEDYTWPGNVRELRNAVARQLALGELAHEPRPSYGDAPTSLAPGPMPAMPAPDAGAGGPDVISRVLDARLPFIQARGRVMTEFETRYVERVLADHGGDVAKAAAASGIGRRYFQMIRARTRG